MYQNNMMENGDDGSSASSSSSSVSHQNNTPTRSTAYSHQDSGSSLSNGSDESDDDSELAPMQHHQPQYQQEQQQYMNQATTTNSQDNIGSDNGDFSDDENESDDDESSEGDEPQHNEHSTSYVNSNYRQQSTDGSGLMDSNPSSTPQTGAYENDSEEEGNGDDNESDDESDDDDGEDDHEEDDDENVDDEDDEENDDDDGDDEGDGNNDHRYDEAGFAPRQGEDENNMETDLTPPLRGKILRKPEAEMEPSHNDEYEKDNVDGENGGDGNGDGDGFGIFDDGDDDNDNDDNSEGGDNLNDEQTELRKHTGKPDTPPQSSSMVSNEAQSNSTIVNEASNMLSDGESSSSDDELLVSHKSKKKKKPSESSSTTKKKSTSRTSKTNTTKKKAPLSSPKKKRKKPSSTKKRVEDDEVTAAVVVDDDINSDTDTSAMVVVAEVIPDKKRKKPGPKPKKKSKDVGTSSSNKNRKGASSSSSSGKKTKKRRLSNSENSMSSDSSSSATQNALPSTSIIPHDKLQAAEQARDILINSVQRIPIEISDSYTVRNFGRIKIEDGAIGLQTMYSSANSLHPVGFSCDRYEFSPVHGRVIKMRCDIVDGSKIGRRSSNRNGDEGKDSKEANSDGGSRDSHKKKAAMKDGPIFRIMWGIGIDESHDARSFPFDLYSASTPLGVDVDAVAVPLGQNTVNVAPEPGMRVKVRFDSDWYGGSIRKVQLRAGESVERKNTRSEGKKKKESYNIQISYDDGGKENSIFPDPDIVLLPPGSEETADGCVLNVTEIKGKAVTTVTGRTPLEAWGKALIQLGLIDEIMLEMAEESVASARLEGLAEVKEKMEAVKKQRQEARARHIQRQKEKIKEESIGPIIVKVKNGEAIEPDDLETTSDEADKDDDGMEERQETELPTTKEINLRERVAELREIYDTRLAKSRAVAIDLANARISSLGPFLSNPFFEVDDSLERMKNWLATVVRKEKSKMGSTGNRRKIVTATDLLERNATFLNTHVERLVEGLPGTEFCSRYVFHELRGHGAYSANQSWVHEEQLRQERDQQKRQKRAHEDEAKACFEREKELKRKTREDERNSRKKQRLEEIEGKRKAREEDRLSRLATQVDERLFKEACFQRERVILLASKLIGKELMRRRKAAEVISAYVVESAPKLNSNIENNLSRRELPPISKNYNVDVVRVWNFIHSYRSAFEELGNLTSLPSLDSLQNAIDSIATKSTEKVQRTKAIDLLTNIAIGLCKPVIAAVIKTLSSVLTTNLQEHNTTKTSTSGEKTIINSDDPDFYPVNVHTWREVARLILLNDALNELGYSKQEQAHILRGFRSGGHPNSKEAKRLRRGEDYALVLRKQALSEMAKNVTPTPSNNETARRLRCTVNTPCEPSAKLREWIFFLHNIKALPINAASGMKSNLRKARLHLRDQETNIKEKKKESILTELQRNISVLEQIGTSLTSSTETMNACTRVRQSVLRILDKATGEHYSTDIVSEAVYRDISVDNSDKKELNKSDKKDFPTVQKENKQHGGMLKSLICTEEDYKKCMQHKEQYMAAAIKLKEDQERKKKRASGDDDEDDDDDDEDDEEEEKEKKGEQDQDTSEAVASVVNNTVEDTSPTDETRKIGKKTIYDDFCGDVPLAPDLVRRCLAVLRTLCLTSPAEPFIYPVDPQTNQKYYESIFKPISLYDIGKFLQDAGKRLSQTFAAEKEIEDVVTKFGRDVRLIWKNCSCFLNVGGAIISSAEEMIRIFERLFFDWVLCPIDTRQPLEMLDDDKCIEHHPSDEGSVMLLCDGCEGKFNMSRLNPPLQSVPQGDWYCPRCLCGRCWGTVDPRIGRKVAKVYPAQDNPQSCASVKALGVITSCMVSMPQSGSTLIYDVRYENGVEETWSLEEIDNALKEIGNPAASIQCLEAVTESPGYCCGTENGLVSEIIPNPLNPRISDAAAQKAVASTVFQDTVIAAASLLVTDADTMDASEWLRLIILLLMKCITSDPLQEVVSKLENMANLKVAGVSSEVAQIKSVVEILPNVTDDEDDGILTTGEENPGDNDTNVDIRTEADNTLDNILNLDDGEEQECNESNGNGSIIKAEERLVDNGRNMSSSTSKIKTEVNPPKSVDIKEDPSNDNANKDNAGNPIVKTSGVKIEEAQYPDSILSAKDLDKKKWVGALAAKKQRQKAREDAFLALCIESQTKPIVASFEEDHVTQVVESSLTAKVDGIELASCQCPDTKCEFCGLTDIALGTPLVRIPNQEEWYEMMHYLSKNRRCQLVAEITERITPDESMVDCKTEESCTSEDLASTKESFRQNEEEKAPPRIVKDESLSRVRKKIVAVKVSVDGKLVSTAVDDPEKYENITNGGMVEFLPRNEDGFQHEMTTRLQHQLPFITGSMSGHECCALAAHRARIDKLVQERKDLMTECAEKEYGTSCGRTLPIGIDSFGRSYWKFDLDPLSLFILDRRSDGTQIFHRFSEPESIASLIVYLKKNEPADEIKRAFPKSDSLLVGRKWAGLLQNKRFSRAICNDNGMKVNNEKEDVNPIVNDEDIEDIPYEEGEDVLVESSAGNLLWNATIIAVAKSRNTKKIICYRVHYKEWSSRFDEWVDVIRVVEPSDNNLLVQQERLEESIAGRLAIPESLKYLQAKTFLEKKIHATGSSDLPNFAKVATFCPGATSVEKLLATLRAGILLVEAALPSGSIKSTDDCIWNTSTASCWRSMVTKADNPSSLIGCLILLESVISTDWLRPNSEHLLSSLSRPWKAVNEASVSSIALRLWILDSGIKYGLVIK